MELLAGYTAVAVITILTVGFIGYQICKSIDNGVNKLEDGLKNMSEKKTSIREFEDFIHFLAGFDKTNMAETKAVAEKVKEEPKKPKKKVAKEPKKANTPPTRYGETWRTVYYTSAKGTSIEKERYYISNFGRIWDTKKGAFISTFYSKPRKCMIASFYRDDGKRATYSVKILVALAFIGYFNPAVKKVVCINGNEMDIQETNLRLETIVKRSKTTSAGWLA